MLCHLHKTREIQHVLFKIELCKRLKNKLSIRMEPYSMVSYKFLDAFLCKPSHHRSG